MKLSAKRINKITTYIFFMAAIFMQAFVDGFYIAYGDEPTTLKVVKYALIAGGILWGLLQIFPRKRFVFLKELRNIMLAVFVFLVVSLFLILLQDGNLGTCLELIMRYTISLLYAFVLLNTMEFDDIYRLMTYALVISIFGFFLEKGDNLFNLSFYSQISFDDSFSPFESHYFAAPSINCCAFFLYYRKNKLVSVLSFLFVLLTFKRPQIIFAVLFLLLPLVADPNKRIRKTTHGLICIGTIIGTMVWYWLLLSQNEWILEEVTGLSANEFTSGRSDLLRSLLYNEYKMGGLGSTAVALGRSIEMDLVIFMLEMSFPVMALFVFAFASLSGRRIYAALVLTFQLFSFMTSSGLYNIVGMLLLYLFFGSVNYLQPDALGKIERSRKRWIRIKFR